jgi:hypothetical protein
MSFYETPDGIDWLNLSQSSRDTSQGTELVNLPMEERVGKMNAITNPLHNSFKIKDNSLTERNYHRNKKYVP